MRECEKEKDGGDGDRGKEREGEKGIERERERERKRTRKCQVLREKSRKNEGDMEKIWRKNEGSYGEDCETMRGNMKRTKKE